MVSILFVNGGFEAGKEEGYAEGRKKVMLKDQKWVGNKEIMKQLMQCLMIYIYIGKCDN